VRVDIPENDNAFFNVQAPSNIKLLRTELRAILAILGHDDLDAVRIGGPDRRITRAISQWAWSQVDETDRPRFAGVRYLSRMRNDWEYWAVFDHVPIEERERQPILLTSPGLKEVADYYDLTVF
jgi:hypothetical protein